MKLLGLAALASISSLFLADGQRIGAHQEVEDDGIFVEAGDEDHPPRKLSECTIDNLPRFGQGVVPEPVVRFIGMGDTPYAYEDRFCLNHQLRRLNTRGPNAPKFIVHIGDIKIGKPEYPCNRKAYSDIAEIFSHPNNTLNYDHRDTLFMPGDNEWSDCQDTDEAWKLWMEHFGPGNKYGFGQLTSGVTIHRQNDAARAPGVPRSENFAFFMDKVLFMGANVVGGNLMGDERKRYAQNIDWVRKNVRKYAPMGMKGVVVFGHAQIVNGARYKYFGNQFSRLAEEYPDVPFVYFHGNGHNFCISQPFQAGNVVDVEVEDGDSAPPLVVTLMKDPNSDKHLFDVNPGEGRYRDKGGDCPHIKEQTWATPTIGAPKPPSPPAPTPRPTSLEKIIIGPEPTAPSFPTPTVVLPPPFPEVQYIENPPTSVVPLDECQGRCTKNEDCKGNYNCFKRLGNEPIPGCSGTPLPGKHYCYNGPSPTPAPTKKKKKKKTRRPRPKLNTQPPPKDLPQMKFVANFPNPAFPLGECEGDCDNNAQCKTGLYCLKREHGDPVPQCTGTPRGDNDYCVPYPEGVLVLIGNNGDPKHHFPLGECHGDCDKRHECAPGLQCFKRKGYETVPGCMGLGRYGKDYCYDPQKK